ncbi:MAG: leucine-rich repeat protein [Christensenellaceae bacterium]|jgi:hypothetical protein|nr:leucine-rich repeat protein [Christensenellaceae bacterium]
MKKSLIIALIFATILILTACSSADAKAYTVQFEVNDGTAIESVVTAEIKEFPVSVREGYLLTDWYLDPEFNYKATFPYKPLGQTVLYAKWEASYSLTYRLGTTIHQIDYYLAGDPVTPIKDPVLEGGRFTGWEEEIPSIMPARNVTINGSFTPETYYICFEVSQAAGLDTVYTGTTGSYKTTDDGVSINYPCISVLYGYAYANALNAVKASRPGYDFDGWTYYDSEKHERFDFVASATWDSSKNWLLRPKWVQFGTQGLKFSKIPHNDENVCMVSGYEGQYEQVIVPSTHEGKTVIRIDAGAFSGSTNITSMTLPSTLTQIGENAFFGCKNITTINLPSSLETIGKGAFSGCESIISVTIPNGITTVQALTFADCISLRKVEFPQNINFIRIEDQAFQNCVALFDFTLPESLKIIGKYAFEGCSTLTSLQGIMTSNLTEIGDGAFRDCVKLEKVTFPSTLQTIGAEAFKNCERLLQVGAQEGLLSIGARAFMNCIVLQRFSIPKTTTSLGSSIFLNNPTTLLYVLTVDVASWPDGWSADWCLKNADTGEKHPLTATTG